MIVNRENIERFINTERAVSNIGRILGAISKAYIEPEADDSHTNFFWCSTNLHLETRHIHLPNDEVLSVSYHPSHFHIHFETETETKPKQEQLVLLKNNSLDYVLKKTAETLSKFGLDPKKFHDHVEFRYPELTNINGKLFTPEKSLIHQFELIQSSANNLLISYIISNNIHAELPRVWPYNFDTGIVCFLDDNIIQYAGYAPADNEVCKVPYFYNSFYKNNQQIISDSVLTVGEWQKEGWKGAILRMDDFNDSAEFLDAVLPFIKQSSEQINKTIN